MTNIYSTEFKVETADAKEGKKFVQVWHDNMSVADDPKITNFKGKEYTEISYTPDLKLFNMNGFDDDIVSLMEKRVYDMAGVTDSSLKVLLNSVLPIGVFEWRTHWSQELRTIHKNVSNGKCLCQYKGQ